MASSRTTTAVVAGSLTALAGAGLLTVLGSLLALSAGLLVVAFFVGRFTALAVATAASPARGPTIGRRQLAALSVVLGFVGVLVGQLGLWLVARAQGGTLELAAFLTETYGVLVPAELALAAIGAWWPLRR